MCFELWVSISFLCILQYTKVWCAAAVRRLPAVTGRFSPRNLAHGQKCDAMWWAVPVQSWLGGNDWLVPHNNIPESKLRKAKILVIACRTLIGHFPCNVAAMSAELACRYCMNNSICKGSGHQELLSNSATELCCSFIPLLCFPQNSLPRHLHLDCLSVCLQGFGTSWSNFS